MHDHLIIATACNGQIRALAAVTTGLVEEARQRHDCWPTAAAVLGRSLTGGLLLGAILKKGQRLTLRVLGDGPCGAVVVDVDDSSHVRGYLQEPHVNLPATSAGKLDVGGAVGKGFLAISKDLGFGDPYVGQVPLQNGEIATDLAYYFAVSEQIPSAVGLGVLVNPDGQVKTAGGYLLQMLPGAAPDLAEMLEQRLAAAAMPTELIQEVETAEAMLKRFFSADELTILETREVYYQCNCSRERLQQILMSISDDELQEMTAKQEPVEMICHFCRTAYYFQPEEISALRKRKQEKRDSR
ncbi:MAG: Hsp33 family molecular chaperone HslO [Negativicutes bacterium]|nr:Hsp33 family molecular chaperone HslO [Negativicutes bacterium]